MKIKKSVVFIGIRQILNYNFKEFENKFDLRKILIIGKKNSLNINTFTFEEIYFVNESCDDSDILCEYNYQEIHQIIDKELLVNKNLTIICQDEGNVLNTARLRDEFDLTGPRFNEICIFRDKIKMKQRVSEYGIRVPKYEILEFNYSKTYYERLTKEICNKLIIKPINSAASNKVCLINNFEEFVQFLGFSEKDEYDYEVEEFIEGRMFHVDTVVHKKKVHFVGCCALNLPPIQFANGYPTSSFPLNEEEANKVKNFGLKSIEALGFPDGIQHTEIFLSNNGEFVFLESGARAPGLFVVELYNSTYNINILNLELSLVLNTTMDIDARTGNYLHAFSIVWPTKKGKLRRNELPLLKGSYKLNWNHRDGEILGIAQNALNILVTIIVYNEDYNNAKEDFDLLTGDFEMANFD